MNYGSPELKNIGTVFSNVDHTFDYEVRGRLESASGIAGHSAENFYAYITKRGGKYASEVWIHHRLAARHEAVTLEELISIHNDTYGGE